MHKHVFDAEKINPFEGVHHAGARPVGGSKDKAVRRREIEAAARKGACVACEFSSAGYIPFAKDSPSN